MSGIHTDSAANVWNGTEHLFTDAAWLKARLSVTASAAAGPDGVAGSAMKLVEDAVGDTHLLYRYSGGAVSTPSLAVYYVAAAERTQCAIQVGAGSTSFSVFDLSAGTVLSSVAGGTATIDYLITVSGIAWYRVTNLNASDSVANLRYAICPASGGAVPYNGDGTSGIYCWGAQCEINASTPSFTMWQPDPVSARIPRQWRIGSVASSTASTW